MDLVKQKSSQSLGSGSDFSDSSPQLLKQPSSDMGKKEFLRVTKQHSLKTMFRKEEKQASSNFSEYLHQPSLLLRWIYSALDRQNQDENEWVKSTLLAAKQPLSSNLFDCIVQQIKRGDNYLGFILRQGFFPYLLKKYQTNNYSHNRTFLGEFLQDIRWFKSYFVVNILNVYALWTVGQDLDRIRDHLERRVFIDILTQCKEWQTIYRVFVRCLGKQRFGVEKSDAQGYLKQLGYDINHNKNPIPFTRTIETIYEFSDCYRPMKKIDAIRDLQLIVYSQLKLGEGRETQKGICDDTTRKCLSYCILMSGKQVFKSILYLKALYGQFMFESSHFVDVKPQLQSLEVATKDLLCWQLAGQSMLPALPYDMIEFENTHNSKQAQPISSAQFGVQDEDYMKAPHNGKIAFFSKKPLVVGSQIKLLIVSKEKCQVSLGVCRARARQQHSVILQFNPDMIVFSTRTRRVYQDGHSSVEQVPQNIYRVEISIKQGNRVQWLINEPPNNRVIVRNYGKLTLQGQQIYACVGLRNDTEVRIIEY